LGFETVCLYFVFSRPDCWVFGWESTIDRGGRFCYFAEFSEVVGLKMSDQGDIWGDPKGKSISRGEKRRMEAEARGPRFSRASGSNNDGTKPGEECKAGMRLVCEPRAGSGEQGKRERGAGIVIRNPNIDKFYQK
jgi:hypothetical protein